MDSPTQKKLDSPSDLRNVETDSPNDSMIVDSTFKVNMDNMEIDTEERLVVEDDSTDLPFSSTTIELYNNLIKNGETDEYWEEKGGNEPWLGMRLISAASIDPKKLILLVETDIQGQTKLITVSMYIEQLRRYEIGINKGQYRVNEDYIDTNAGFNHRAVQDFLRVKLCPNLIYTYKQLKYNVKLVGKQQIFPKNSLWSKNKVTQRFEEYLIQLDSEFKQSAIPSFVIAKQELIDYIPLYRGIEEIKNTLSFEEEKTELKKHIQGILFGIIATLHAFQLRSFYSRNLNSTDIILTTRRVNRLGLHKNYNYVFDDFVYKVDKKYQKFKPVVTDFNSAAFTYVKSEGYIGYQVRDGDITVGSVNNITDTIIDKPVTDIKYRDPEQIFLTTLETYQDNSSDVFSAGLSIIDFIEEQPNFVYNRGYNLLDDKQRGYNILDDKQRERGDRNLLSKVLREYRKTVCRARTTFEPKEYLQKRKKFLCRTKDENEAIVIYTLGLISILGSPEGTKNRRIKQTAFYKVLKKYKFVPYVSNYFESDNVKKYLPENGIKMLESMLTWNRDERIKPSEIVYDESENNYFGDLFKKETLDKEQFALYKDTSRDSYYGYSKYNPGIIESIFDKNTRITPLNGRFFRYKDQNQQVTRLPVGTNLCENCGNEAKFKFQLKNKEHLVCSEPCRNELL